MKQPHIRSVCSSTEREYLWPIHYSFNYLEGCSKFLNPETSPMAHYQVATYSELELSHAIDLHPVNAKLPWPTAIACLRQTKHWKTILDLTTKLLELFADDETAKKSKKTKTKSFADIARAELDSEMENSWCRFAGYLFPFANKERIWCITSAIVYVFIFDDVWEENDEKSLKPLQRDFISRLQAFDEGEKDTPRSCLQKFIDSTINGFREQDAIKGNGGREVVDRLIDFCNHMPPEKEFASMRHFLDYRAIDAAVPMVLACVKFSLGLSIEIDQPKFARFRELINDHVSIANDLGSFAKEKEAFEKGHVCYMINAVQMMEDLMGPDHDDDSRRAKSMTYALQLDVEERLEMELARLRNEENLNEEEWQFVGAVLLMLSGNICTSIVMARYGGFGCKISDVHPA